MPEEQQQYNAADPEQVKSRKLSEKQALRQYLADVEAILKLPEGRRFLWKLLCDCHIFQTSFSQNALTMANWEGERNVGLKIWATLEQVSPEIILLLMKENQRHSNPEK